MKLPGWVYGVFIILVGLAEVWVYFIEPSIKAREDASSQKRRDKIEERKSQLELDREEFKFLREELKAQREELRAELEELKKARSSKKE
jgi:F0F1-type ATP synthase membrane subunit b/b'